MSSGRDGNIYTGSAGFLNVSTNAANYYGSTPSGNLYTFTTSAVTSFTNNYVILGAGGSVAGVGGSAIYNTYAGLTIYNYGALLGGGGGANSGGVGGVGGGGGGYNEGAGGSLIATPGTGGGGGPNQNGGEYSTSSYLGGTGGGNGGGNGTSLGAGGNSPLIGGDFIFGGGGGAYDRTKKGEYGSGGGGYGGGNGGATNNGGGGGGGGGGFGGAGPYAGAKGGYSIYNTGTITNLYNSQGGKNYIYGPLFYGGTLPSSKYYIIINSSTNYGQLYCTGWAATTTDINYNKIDIDPASNITGTVTLKNVLVGNCFVTNSGTKILNNGLKINYSIVASTSTPTLTIGSIAYNSYDLSITLNGDFAAYSLTLGSSLQTTLNSNYLKYLIDNVNNLNTVTTNNTTYHVFTKTGTNYINFYQTVNNVEIVIIAGGGSGGDNHGGGGGAGGLVTYLISGGTSVNVSPGTYTINVGTGGISKLGGGNTNGGNSYTTIPLATTAAIGGGRGGGASTGMANITYNIYCGSGGGGSGYYDATYSNANYQYAGFGTAGQGSNGGSVSGNPNSGAGGGSYTGTGGSMSNNGSGYVGGSGGAGTSILSTWINDISGIMPISWQKATSGGVILGGGGGSWDKTGGIGGTGGGGNGGGTSNLYPNSVPGIDNTGSGGGGGSDGGGQGANGGAGIVIIRYSKTVDSVINAQNSQISIATTDYVQKQFNNTTLTGVSRATTPFIFTNDTTIATTQYVKNQKYANYNATNSNYNLSGGGIVIWNGSQVTWDTPIVAINLQSGYSENSYFTIDGRGGSYLPLTDWQSLYYCPKYGMGQGYNASLLKILNKTDPIEESWIFICCKNGDMDSLKWNPGYITIPAGGIYNSITGFCSWKTNNFVGGYTGRDMFWTPIGIWFNDTEFIQNQEWGEHSYNYVKGTDHDSTYSGIKLARPGIYEITIVTNGYTQCVTTSSNQQKFWDTSEITLRTILYSEDNNSGITLGLNSNGTYSGSSYANALTVSITENMYIMHVSVEGASYTTTDTVFSANRPKIVWWGSSTRMIPTIEHYLCAVSTNTASVRLQTLMIKCTVCNSTTYNARLNFGTYVYISSGENTITHGFLPCKMIVNQIARI